jgi:hypothetical protein
MASKKLNDTIENAALRARWMIREKEKEMKPYGCTNAFLRAFADRQFALN